MRRPLSEHDSTIRSRRGGLRPDDDTGEPLQPVPGGRVRRIVFSGDERRAAEPPRAPEPRPEPEPEPEPPRHARYRPRAAMDEIHADVDRIIGRRRAPQAPRTDGPDRSTVKERTVYKTDRGSVRSTEYTSEGRRRKAIYLSRREGGSEKERRFLLSEVDKVIADVPPPRPAEATAHPKAQPAAPERRPEQVKKRIGGKVRRGPPVLDEEPEALETTHEEEAQADDRVYRPQCGAVTADGRQCRNSAKGGSPYCGSHQGHRPLSMKQLGARGDTKPRHARAEDTMPGQTGAAGAELQPQCAALTKDGKQCRNSSRKSSKYCSAHKGYRAPSRAEWVRRLDTKPSVAKAQDTKPSLQKGRRKPRQGGSRTKK